MRGSQYTRGNQYAKRQSVSQEAVSGAGQSQTSIYVAISMIGNNNNEGEAHTQKRSKYVL